MQTLTTSWIHFINPEINPKLKEISRILQHSIEQEPTHPPEEEDEDELTERNNQQKGSKEKDTKINQDESEKKEDEKEQTISPPSLLIPPPTIPMLPFPRKLFKSLRRALIIADNVTCRALKQSLRIGPDTYMQKMQHAFNSHELTQAAVRLMKQKANRINRFGGNQNELNFGENVGLIGNDINGDKLNQQKNGITQQISSKDNDSTFEDSPKFIDKIQIDKESEFDSDDQCLPKEIDSSSPQLNKEANQDLIVQFTQQLLELNNSLLNSNTQKNQENTLKPDSAEQKSQIMSVIQTEENDDRFQLDLATQILEGSAAYGDNTNMRMMMGVTDDIEGDEDMNDIQDDNNRGLNMRGFEDEDDDDYNQKMQYAINDSLNESVRINEQQMDKKIGEDQILTQNVNESLIKNEQKQSLSNNEIISDQDESSSSDSESSSSNTFSDGRNEQNLNKNLDLNQSKANNFQSSSSSSDNIHKHNINEYPFCTVFSAPRNPQLPSIFFEDRYYAAAQSAQQQQIPLVVCLSTPSSSIPDTLVRFRPHTVILAEPDAPTVRQLEVYYSTYRYRENYNNDEQQGNKDNNKDKDSDIFFVVYWESIEQQMYVDRVRRENECFKKLQEKQQTLVVRKTITAQQAADIQQQRLNQNQENESQKLSQQKLSLSARALQRMNANQIPRTINEGKIIRRIVVDIREFRSPLPLLLHRAGFEVLPKQIEVGDYVLSPRIAVERKSPSDLSQSLASGHLAAQATALTASYPIPILLIEFGAHTEDGVHGDLLPRQTTSAGSTIILGGVKANTFRQQGVNIHGPLSTSVMNGNQKDDNTRNNTHSSYVSFIPSDHSAPPVQLSLQQMQQAVQVQAHIQTAHNTMNRLLLLSLHFPALRIVWSQSPSESVKLFGQLKIGESEPDGALSFHSDTPDALSRTPARILGKMPGVSSIAVERIGRVASNLSMLAKLSREDLEQAMGGKNASTEAATLHAFLHMRIAVPNKQNRRQGEQCLEQAAVELAIEKSTSETIVKRSEKEIDPELQKVLSTKKPLFFDRPSVRQPFTNINLNRTSPQQTSIQANIITPASNEQSSHLLTPPQSVVPNILSPSSSSKQTPQLTNPFFKSVQDTSNQSSKKNKPKTPHTVKKKKKKSVNTVQSSINSRDFLLGISREFIMSKGSTAKKKLALVESLPQGIYAEYYKDPSRYKIIIQNWGKDYVEDKRDAILQILNLLIQASGCNYVLNELLNDCTEEVSQEMLNFFNRSGIYPIIDKQLFKGDFAKFFPLLWSELLDESVRTGAIYENDITPFMNWLCALSGSACRPFRHTLSIVGLEIATQLMNIVKKMSIEIKDLEDEIDKKRKLLSKQQNDGEDQQGNEEDEDIEDEDDEDDENKTKRKQKPTPKQKQKQQDLNKMKANEQMNKSSPNPLLLSQINELLQEYKNMGQKRLFLLKIFTDSFFHSIFFYRFRDSMPVMRKYCIETLHRWIFILPEQFLSNNYTKYIGWHLYDKDSQVREAAMDVLLSVLNNSQFFPPMNQFLTKFLPRINDAIDDIEEAVAATAILVLEAILKQQNLPGSVIANVYSHVDDEFYTVRRATGQFISTHLIIEGEKDVIKRKEQQQTQLEKDDDQESNKSNQKNKKEQQSKKKKGRMNKDEDEENEDEENEGKDENSNQQENKQLRQSQLQASPSEMSNAIIIRILALAMAQKESIREDTLASVISALVDTDVQKYITNWGAYFTLLSKRKDNETSPANVIERDIQLKKKEQSTKRGRKGKKDMDKDDEDEIGEDKD
ncbi:MAG: putative DNA repair protein rad16, partial [Streblomastix strix]